jgi:hypothetical protein
MGNLANKKHESQLIAKLLPSLDAGAVVSTLSNAGARVLDFG